MNKLTCLISARDDMDQLAVLTSNGYSQNVKFFYDMLELMGHHPVLLTGSDIPGGRLSIQGREYRALSATQAIDQRLKVDLAFEVAITINDDVRSALRELFGSRVISVRYGPTLMLDMEQIVYQEFLTPGIHVTGADMVWTSPHYTYSLGYLQTLLGCPAEISPYIWEPDFVTRDFHGDERPQRDIYVMEPNLSVIKNALIPMAIIEEVYRTDPEAFGKAMVLNGLGFYQRTYFKENIARSLGVLRAEANKVFFTGRYRFEEVFQQPDVLLGHQWANELNYLYLEALHSGVPLVHNSAPLQEAGFYYPGFDTQAGRERLLEALRHRVGSDVEHNRAFLHRFSIHNPEVQREYRRLMEQVLDLPR